MNSLQENLANKAIKLTGSKNSELERYCWMVVHEYIHGAMPSEYDIREIDEYLYLNVLSLAKEKIQP
ncbi:hypothetical protein [Prochlorococcus sp. MIT 1341]|uniref:hypothetical protein n=1 Tax=Prochlorococcus sp. MIT 1341 TaxID=3096221 RepID=UPI002A75B6C3|nr:hypothetical protein [Prochlorococcus sp. MIT 1341]